MLRLHDHGIIDKTYFIFLNILIFLIIFYNKNLFKNYNIYIFLNILIYSYIFNF